MIDGAHVILYSTNADADRAFLKDVLSLASVDVGHGWLIFGLPPSEIAVHPGPAPSHQLYFTCDDVEAFVARMGEHGIACGPIQSQGWGMLTDVTLPGGGTVGVYQPRHARPPATPARSAKKKAATPKAKAKPAAATKRRGTKPTTKKTRG